MLVVASTIVGFVQSTNVRFWPLTACRERQQWAALYRSCLLSVLVKSDAIGGLIECKRLVKCNKNEWSVLMPSGGQVECNFATETLQVRSRLSRLRTTL